MLLYILIIKSTFIAYFNRLKPLILITGLAYSVCGKSRHTGTYLADVECCTLILAHNKPLGTQL